MGSKEKFPCNQEEIPYIFTKFQNFLNSPARDLSVVSYLYVNVCAVCSTTSLVDGACRATAGGGVTHVLRIVRTRTIPGHSAGDIGTTRFARLLRNTAFAI